MSLDPTSSANSQRTGTIGRTDPPFVAVETCMVTFKEGGRGIALKGSMVTVEDGAMVINCGGQINYQGGLILPPLENIGFSEQFSAQILMAAALATNTRLSRLMPKICLSSCGTACEHSETKNMTSLEEWQYMKAFLKDQQISAGHAVTAIARFLSNTSIDACQAACLATKEAVLAAARATTEEHTRNVSASSDLWIAAVKANARATAAVESACNSVAQDIANARSQSKSGTTD